MCGHHLVVALGSDNDRETNVRAAPVDVASSRPTCAILPERSLPSLPTPAAMPFYLLSTPAAMPLSPFSTPAQTISMLNTATLAWEAWDANVSRRGAAMHLVAAKMLLAGGLEGTDRFSEVVQFNIGNFMIEFDGVDDEIMIPHLPTIIPNAYTIEAWVRPAKAEAMSVIVRTNEQYPMAAWSHQLRINDRGARLRSRHTLQICATIRRQQTPSERRRSRDGMFAPLCRSPNLRHAEIHAPSLCLNAVVRPHVHPQTPII